MLPFFLFIHVDLKWRLFMSYISWPLTLIRALGASCLHQRAATSTGCFCAEDLLRHRLKNKGNLSDFGEKWRGPVAALSLLGHAAKQRSVLTRQADCFQKQKQHNGNLLFYTAQTCHPVRWSGSQMIIITIPNTLPARPLGPAHSHRHTLSRSRPG